MIEVSANIQTFQAYTPDSHTDLRKSRILNRIDDAGWARVLSFRETKREHQFRVRMLDELILGITRDTIARFLQKGTENDLQQNVFFRETVMKQIDNARVYYNDQYLALSRDSNSSMTHSINDRWFVLISPMAST